MKALATSFPQHFFRRSRLTALPVAALSLALTGLVSTLSAAPCSYGEIFDFANTTGGLASQLGTMPKLDIDRQAASVTVTNTSGGNLGASVQGGWGSSFTTNTDEYFFPGFPITASPSSYGHMLSLTGTDQTPLTFAFSKSMRNLTMNFQGGDNKIFTFTDGSGNPLAVTLRSTVGSFGGAFSRSLADPPTSGDGSNSFYVKQLTSNSVAIGEFGYACVQFSSAVTTIKMTQTWVGNSLGNGATYNTSSSTYKINFASTAISQG